MPANVIVAAELFASVAKLTANEQAQVIAFLNTFQSNPANPGVQLHPLNKARSKSMWSGRITQDLRAIVHKDGDTWAVLYADHHDAAYKWGERRDVGRHPVTGALQIVESVETIREVERVIEVLVTPDLPPTFDTHDDAYLLSLGVPEEWLPTVRKVRDDEQLLVLCEQLPDDVSERLLSLADGEFVTPPAPLPAERPAIESSDTQRRFYVVEDADGLAAALNAPMDRWIAFLHPSQRDLVRREFTGPAKVSGSAGTGKTVVAMHRARHLARHGERVLLTSFVTTLCENIRSNLSKLCTAEELQRITVSTVHAQALAIVRKVHPRIQPAPPEEVASLLETLALRHASGWDLGFVRTEWEYVVRQQGISSWAEYRRARRTGRGRALPVKERKILWRVYDGVLQELESRGYLDWPGLTRRAEELLTSGAVANPFSAVVVDEVQDLKPPALRFLRALCAADPGKLMVCGDAGQRIYPGGFSLSALGIEVRGRSTVLRINYRTTEQIRRVADQTLGDSDDDMDGGRESRTGTRSLLHGPPPLLRAHDSWKAEDDAGVATIQGWLAEGTSPAALGVFARTKKRLDQFNEALSAAGIVGRRLSDTGVSAEDAVQLGTMHRAKGLEFKAVLVLDCSEKTLPSTAALRGLVDPQDREAAEARERRLLYVAMTRARDELTVSWVGRPCRFLAVVLEAGGNTVPPSPANSEGSR